MRWGKRRLQFEECIADVPHYTITRHARAAEIWPADVARRQALRQRLADIERAVQQPYADVVLSAIRRQATDVGDGEMPGGLDDCLVPSASIVDTPEFGTIEEVEWGKNHIAIADVRSEAAPTSAVWAMPNAIRTSPDCAWQFWTMNDTKLFPSRSQLDKAGASSNDGLDIDELLLEELRRAAAEAAAPA